MTVVLNDPSLWPEIDYYRGYTYFLGSWRENCLVQSLMCCRSFMLDRSGIRLEYARYQCLSRELLTESLCYFPALTIGQEVGWYDHQSSHLTKHSSIVRTGLGEQSHASKISLDTNASNLGQRQCWSLMTFLYLSVCSFKFWVQVQFKAGVLTSNASGAIHWNTIHCVCVHG